MRVIRTGVAILALSLFALGQAQQQPTQPKETKPAATPNPKQKPKVAATPEKPMTPAPVKDKPLTSLPYTPSLDEASMDKTADPCTDFYQYTCGGWMKNNPMPGDQASWSVYGKLANENMQFLWGILEQDAKRTTKRNATQQKIGDFFGACMDEQSVERLGGSPLKPQLTEINAIKTVHDLTPFLSNIHLKSQTSGFMFGFGSDQDFGDASQVIAFLSAGGLGLPDRDYYLEDTAKMKETREKYVAHVQAMLQLIGEPEEKAKSDAKAVMQIETDLAKASLTRVDKRDPYKLFHKMSVDEAAKLTPSIDWATYLKIQGVQGVKAVNVTEPEFFKALDKELSDQSLENWKAYLRWHLVSSRAPYLSSKFVQTNFDFYSKYLRGVAQQPPRWKRCVRLVDRDLGEALGKEFVDRTFAPKTKDDVLKMTKQIEDAMADEIKALDWMSPETKVQAQKKLDGIRNKIGYPDKWRDYSSVIVKPNDLVGNVERATVFESKRELNKIGKPVDKTEWGMTPPTVNAYYNPQMNDINFPAGVLQPPLYDPKEDDAPNYGNTGGTIGHELTHGFDDEGRQFDAEGNLKDWWTKEDASKFDEKIQCVRDQYAQYTIVDDIKINSKLTSGEDVADLGGTLLAYLAWKKQTAGQDLKDEGGFTPDQRFFIGYAQWACENERPENLRVSAKTNPHSPGKYRVNGIVSNLPEFWKAFSCKAGQPMVREKACKVW
jgi:putative endopeptidase